MASASSIAPSETKAYWLRIYSLVVDGGTNVLRHQFDTRIPHGELQNKLSDPVVRKTLGDLKKKKIITQTQWDILYPQINVNDKPSSEDFDIALLNILLRYLCDIESTSIYWSQGIPPTFDTSLVADISRIRRIRNEFAHVKTNYLTQQSYQQKWDDLEKVILRLGQGIPNLAESINELKTRTIDPENESKYIAELQQWRQNECDWQAGIGETKAKLTEVEKSINNITTTVDQQTSHLHDVTQQLMKVEEINRVTGDKHDNAIKSIISRQNKLEDHIEERIVRETQNVGTVQRNGALVDHMHDSYQQNMQALADLSVEDDERDHLYVTTGAHIQAKEKLLKSGIVILSGSPCDKFLYHVAVLGWNENLIDVLLQHGANPNVRDMNGKTPINVAAGKGATEIVKKLIPVADVNLADNNGHTPLHNAIHRHRTDIAAMLCPVSDVNLQDRYGDTPLHKAYSRLNLEIFKMLIEKYHADIDICNKKEKSVVNILDNKRLSGHLVTFDPDRFLCGSDPFIIRDEYFKVIDANRKS